MPYCTVAEVKNAIDFPATGAPIDDDVIQDFIYDAQEEIEDIYKTHFGVVEDSGTASSATNNTLTDSTKTWDNTILTTSGTWEGYVLWIYSGTGSGQYREILSNTTDTLTVNRDWDTNPDATSLYRITKLGYVEELVDGTGTDTMFTTKQPIIQINYLKNNDIEVTIDTLYIYNYQSKIVAGANDCEINYFSDANPQTTEIRYVFGWYPLPRIIKRLAIILAAMRALTAQIAGTYDDFANVSLPHMSASKGEPYLNIQSSLNYMQGEARGIIYGSGATGQVSADFRTGATFKPLTMFG